jgi:predicted transcriptional regulator
MPTARSPVPADERGEEPGTPAQLIARIEEELELLGRNVAILEKLAKSPPIGIIRLSEALDLPIHKTRYSLHLLEREGVIQPSADGAVVTDRARTFWADLDGSLDRMAVLIRKLKERAAEHAAGGPAPRKGY